MRTAAEERNKAFVLEAFDTLANRRDFAAAQRFWSPDYIQHSAHIPPGRDGLLNLVKAAPPDRRYENALAVADGGRLSTTGPGPNRVTVDIVRLEHGLIAEHWDVVQDEATAQESSSGLPMFGDTFPTKV
jgi:predicted SnoaL-like aldol condensation-catalyzing enzyme